MREIIFAIVLVLAVIAIFAIGYLVVDYTEKCVHDSKREKLLNKNKKMK